MFRDIRDKALHSVFVDHADTIETDALVDCMKAIKELGWCWYISCSSLVIRMIITSLYVSFYAYPLGICVTHAQHTPQSTLFKSVRTIFPHLQPSDHCTLFYQPRFIRI